MSITRMMKGHDLFRALSFEEIERVSRVSGTKTYVEDEQVYRRGSAGTHFFVALEGRINLRLPSDDGESFLVVGRMEKGDIFGLSPLLGMERYVTTAHCAQTSAVLAVEVAPFREVLSANPQVGLSVMSFIARAYFARYVETLRRLHHIFDLD